MQYILNNPAIVAALIAFTGVFITQCIVIVGLVLAEKRIIRELNRKDYSKLIELRLTCYPQAYNITEQLRSRKMSALDAPKLRIIFDELEEWSKGLPQLVMSKESLETFSELRIKLQDLVNIQEPDESYPVTKIRNLNSAFRNALRKDVGLLHYTESQREKK
jgi:hypothetical protein